MAVNFYNIINTPDLVAFLGRIDIRVPYRTEQRTTDHTETWSICHFLATLCNVLILKYPMSLIHRDRPDFLLCSGNQRIGIEVTESIPRDLARFDALAERDNRDILIELPEFGWNAPQRTLTELRDLLRQSGNGRLQSDGWAGDQPEKEWSLLVRNTIHKKLETAKNVEFRKYDSNWLLIYDNLPFMGLDLERSVKYLQAGVGDIWTMEPHFEKIFIESGQTIIEIDANHSTQNSLVDLWQMG